MDDAGDTSEVAFESWASTDDEVWGHYGREYAEESAREALASWTGKDKG
jgi:hypothetical protein